MTVRVGTADGLFVLDGASERQVAGHSVTALSGDWAIFDGETVVYRANGGWRQALTVRSPEPSLGIHGALLSRADEAIVGWGPSLARVFKQTRFEPIPGEDLLLSDGVLPRPSEELLTEWLGTVGSELEAASLDFVLAEHAPRTGEMVPTSTGEIEGQEPFGSPGIAT